MEKRKLIAICVIVLGTIWLAAAAWIHLTMTAITEPALLLPAYFALLFGPPVVLIASAVVLLFRASRIAAICCLAACALLIWSLTPEWFSMVIDLFRAPAPLRPAHNVTDYLIAAAIAVFIACMSIAGLALLRSLIKPSNQSLQPTAGRSDN